MADRTNGAVAEAWAKGKPLASANGNFHTDGWTLYSYATPIGRALAMPDGSRVYLLTSHSYSVTTTTKHMNPAKRAAAYRYFAVPSLGAPGGRNRGDKGGEPDHASNMAHLRAEIAEEHARIQRARVYKGAERLDRLRLALHAYADTFGQPLRPSEIMLRAFRRASLCA